MIKFEEALKVFDNVIFSQNTQEQELSQAAGYILAENIYSDVAMPPFNKSAMDGYACRKKDIGRELVVIETIMAGTLPTKEISEGTCSKIMTGAKLPEGADCVIMVEYTETKENGKIRYTGTETKDNICFKGEDVHVGDCVLKKGNLLNPASIAVAASVGKSYMKVYKPPTIEIITTGDELIEPDEIPKESKIRNSNAYNLMAQIMGMPCQYSYRGIVSDEKDKITEILIDSLNNFDIVLLTGGVSMGDRDFVPEILKENGLTTGFEKLAIQPGKPVVFAYGEGKYCFALSGNPVSSLLQFELLVKPFIYKFMNHDYLLPFVKTRILSDKKRKNSIRQQFFPIILKNGYAEPIEFHGSAHINGLTGMDGFGYFKIGVESISKSEEIEVLLLK